MANVFADHGWYRAPAPVLHARATEASARYLATLALLALLYRPFAPRVPVIDIGRE